VIWSGLAESRFLSDADSALDRVRLVTIDINGYSTGKIQSAVVAALSRRTPKFSFVGVVSGLSFDPRNHTKLHEEKTKAY